MLTRSLKGFALVVAVAVTGCSDTGGDSDSAAGSPADSMAVTGADSGDAVVEVVDSK